MTKLPESKLLSDLRLIRERHLQNVADMRRLLQEMQPLQKPFARDKMPSQNQPAVVPARRASPITTIISIAAEIIEEYGKPIPLLRLMEELKKRGITIGGTNERINLASKLSTAKEVYFVIGRMVAYSPQAGLFR